MKAAQVYTWIGIIVLCVGLIALMHWLQTEPFLATGVCPAGFVFFNDAHGHSFCCKGSVQNKQCTASGKYTMCGLAPNLPDPRSGKPLPTCVQLMKDTDPSSKFCPSNIPNYVAPGLNDPNSWKYGGCSSGRPTGNGSIFPEGRLCLISNTTILNERKNLDKKFLHSPFGQPSCETLKLQETVKCPPNMSVKYDEDMYIYCMQNNSKYDAKNDVPVWCAHDESIAMIPDKTGKPRGLEQAKHHCMSCSYYKKRYIDKDTTAKCVNE
jgi:hypothetical protein